MATIKNKSNGYGYNYASLADIAEQGEVIPKMTVRVVEGNEYIFYYDSELKEWLQGAKIVVPNAKGMNEAQTYGSALTYARRYTVLMANGLACQDDKEIENLAKNGYKKGPISENQMSYIKKLYDPERLERMLAYYQVKKIEDLDASQASEAISNGKKG